MRKRLSAASVLAIVLWTATVLVPVVRAEQDQAGPALTDESLQKMLDNMGYEPKKLSKGWLIAPKKDGWTYNIQFVLSSDGTRLGMNANMGGIEKLEDVTAAQWMDLLTANEDIDPSCFYVDKEKKKLYMHRVLDNRAITPAYIRNQVDNFCANIKDTEKYWKFTK